jgi:hypothetical protein
MTTKQLRLAHQAQPFLPFAIHLADGKSFDVPHREFLSYSDGRIAIVHEPGGKWNIVDLLLVTRLEFSPPQSMRTGNGSHEN